jgi:SHS2 domain-containing protein
MHSKIQEWLQHPLTKALVKVLEEGKESAIEATFEAETDVNRVRYIERVRVYKEILDFDNLLLGEIEE